MLLLLFLQPVMLVGIITSFHLIRIVDFMLKESFCMQIVDFTIRSGMLVLCWHYFIEVIVKLVFRQN